MKPHSKIRKLAKWTLVSSSILLLSLWLGTHSYEIRWVRADMYASIQRGTLYIDHTPSTFYFPALHGWASGPTSGGWSWKWSLQYNSIRSWHVVTPLWAPAAILSASAACLWHIDRRANRRKHLCQHCRYDLRGITDAKCPECGKTSLRELSAKS